MIQSKFENKITRQGRKEKDPSFTGLIRLLEVAPFFISCKNDRLRGACCIIQLKTPGS